MAKSKRGLDYPLATHILRLQDYTPFFDLSEIVLFEWFVIKGESFNYKKFYYSNRRITEEIKIKDDRLKKILARFSDLGIIIHTKEGLPKTSHYIVNYNVILMLLEKIYYLPKNSKLMPYYSQLSAQYSKHKEYIKEGVKEVLKEETMPGLLSIPAGTEFELEHNNTADIISTQNISEAGPILENNSQNNLIQLAVNPVKKGMAEAWIIWNKENTSVCLSIESLPKGYWVSLDRLAKMFIDIAVERYNKLNHEFSLEELIKYSVNYMWTERLLNRWELFKDHWIYGMNDPNKILKHITTILQFLKNPPPPKKAKPNKVFYPTY